MKDQSDERARLDALSQMAYAGRSPSARVFYPLYLAVLFAGIYGVTLLQGLLGVVSQDSARRDTFLGWAIGVLLLVLVLTPAGAYAAGRVRGPVVPDVGLLDIGIPTDINRSALLLPWWRAAVLTTATGGAVLGTVLAASLAIQDFTPPWSIAVGAGAGAVFGWLVVRVWLRGQVAGTEGNPRTLELTSARTELAQLSSETLRAQAYLGHAVTAAIYAGDLAHLRREVNLGRPRARTHRLAAVGPVWTTVRADLLIVRRAPWAAAAGIALIALGAPLGVWATQTRNAAMAIALALVVLNAGAGLLMRGLRAQADNAVTGSLIGPSATKAALLHTVIGAAPVAVAWTVSALLLNADGPPWLTVLVGVLLTVIGSQVVGAYRGVPPAVTMIGSEGAGGVLALWLLLPHVMPLAAGLIAGALATQGFSPAVALLLLGALAVGAGVLRLRGTTSVES